MHPRTIMVRPVMGGSNRGTKMGEGGQTPLKNHKWLKVSLENLVRTPLEKQLDSLSTIASRGRSVQYVDN